MTPRELTDEEKAKRVEEIRATAVAGGSMKWAVQQRFLLAELDRVTAERDELEEAKSWVALFKRYQTADGSRRAWDVFRELVDERDVALARAEKAEHFAETANAEAADSNMKCADVMLERDALRAQVEKLRGVLNLSTHPPGCHPSEGRHTAWCLAVREALAATAPKESKKDKILREWDELGAPPTGALALTGKEDGT